MHNVTRVQQLQAEATAMPAFLYKENYGAFNTLGESIYNCAIFTATLNTFYATQLQVIRSCMTYSCKQHCTE